MQLPEGLENTPFKIRKMCTWFLFLNSGIPWRSRWKMCLYCSNESIGSRKNLRLENPIWTKTWQKSRRINRWHNARCPSHYASQCYCNYPGKMGCSISILANSKLRSGILYFLLGQNNNKLFARGDINSYETLHLLIALLITPRNKSGVRITV